MNSGMETHALDSISALVHKSLRDDLLRILRCLSTASVHICLLRGGDKLPAQSGFDIDILLQKDQVKLARSELKEVSKKLDAITLFSIGNNNKFKMFLCSRDVDRDYKQRHWLLFDFQSELPGFNFQVEFSFSELYAHQLEWAPTGVYGIPASSHLALTYLRASQRDDLKDCEKIKAFAKSVNRTTKDQFESIISRDHTNARTDAPVLNEERSISWFESLRKKVLWVRKSSTDIRLGVIRMVNSGKCQALKSLSQWLFFLPVIQPRLYVVSGADGVGKTTACDLVAKSFEDIPIEIHAFHHTKYVKDTVKVRARGAKGQVSRSLVYRLIRYAWRVSVPAVVKQIVLGIMNESRYLYFLNKRVCISTLGDSVSLSDRYSFDRLVKAGFTGKKAWQKRLFSLTCRLSKRPKCVFILTDKPNNIFLRKQELSVNEIEKYQSRLNDLLIHDNQKTVIVNAEGRNALEIASEIREYILNDLDVQVFGLLSAWESQYR